jgi:acyl-CoA synthetase (AMP-forming)/AMP-acid ligase II
VLGTMPLFHIAACNLCIAALFAGARAEIVRDATAAELAGIIPSRGINLVPLPPVLIHGMLRLPDIRSRDFSALKVMLVAGSGIAEELIREATAVFNCGFALSYGSTETCGGVTYLGPGECVTGAGDRLRSAGRELWESAVRIVHADGSECQPGEVGEILCRSNRLMTGYWKREQATAESLRDGWFHSGDAGFLDAERYLYVVDRIKDMVISGGENIYPAEIEGALFTHPGIEDAAVVGIPDAQWGESLLAFVVPRAGHSPSPAEIEAFLRERLAGYKVPRRYEFVGTLPRNATGKVLKRELRAPYWQGRARRAATSGDSAPS